MRKMLFLARCFVSYGAFADLTYAV